MDSLDRLTNAVFQMFRFKETIKPPDFYDALGVLEAKKYIKYAGGYAYELTDLGKGQLKVIR
jgi:hypothetical protein